MKARKPLGGSCNSYDYYMVNVLYGKWQKKHILENFRISINMNINYKEAGKANDNIQILGEVANSEGILSICNFISFDYYSLYP